MNFLIVILLLVIAIGCIYFFFIKKTESTNIKELYAEGLDMLVSGKRKAAYKNFKLIVEKDSNNIRAYIRLGQVLREGGKVAKAIKMHKNLLIRKDITNYEMIELYKNLTLDYYKIKNYKQSIVECKKILEYESNNEWAINQLILLSVKDKDWSQATHFLKTSFEKTGKIDNDKLSLFKIQQSKKLINEKKFNEAREILDKALNLKQDSYPVYYFIAKSYSEESSIEYNKAVEIQNKGSESLSDSNEYNQFLEQAKKILSKAIPFWVHFTEINPNQSWLVLPSLKDALFVLDRYSELENILLQLNEKNKDNIEILVSLADYYSHKGEVDKAINLIDSYENNREENFVLIKLMKVKLELQKSKNNVLSNELDKIFNLLIKDKRYQFLNNESSSSDMKWLLEEDDLYSEN
ncbi:MAG: hypothetical protein CMG09_07040 [Candidatus Marinimicrobia bacterium]|nr:hypothetical protein [Candidatus Neomarinimicrobiota bacterium]